MRSQSPHASFLGVGAPEAFVVGVVALIVFGPKGLADVRLRTGSSFAFRMILCARADASKGSVQVAKSVGKTLKSFQPTIQELQARSLLSPACSLLSRSPTRRLTPLLCSASRQSVSREFQSALKDEVRGRKTPFRLTTLLLSL